MLHTIKQIFKIADGRLIGIMHIQTIYSLLVIGILVTFGKAQNVTTGAKPVGAAAAAGPVAAKCPVPRAIEEEFLKPATASGSYPSKEIQDQLTKQKLKNAVHNAKLATEFSMTLPKSPALGQPFLSWVDTCPAITAYYTIPKAVIHNGKICWVLKPWSQHKIRYSKCRSFQKCRYVIKQNLPGFVSDPYCVSSNWKYHWYYVICPRPWFIYRKYVRLPQCCSCQRVRCGIPFK